MYGAELAQIERRLAVEALEFLVVRRLMTILKADAMIPVTLPVTVRDFHRFPSAARLVSYPGLNSRVLQYGGRAPTTTASPRPDAAGSAE